MPSWPLKKFDCLCLKQRLHGANSLSRSFTRSHLSSQAVSAGCPLLPNLLAAIEIGIEKLCAGDTLSLDR